jgi:hypothetical protein
VEALATRRHAARLTAVAAIALALAACGSGNPGGPDATWVQLTEKTACEALSPAFCVGVYGFTVTSDGRYTVGPAGDGTSLSGALTDAERARIFADAASLASSLGGAQVCDSAGTVPGVGDSIDLTDSQNVVTRVYDLGLKTCYRGGRAQATQLHTDLRSLMDRYYPRPFPS